MAVAAIDPEAAYVMLMAEGNRLFARHILHGFVRRSHDQVRQSADDYQSTDKSKNAEPGNGISALGEILRHQRRFRTDRGIYITFRFASRAPGGGKLSRTGISSSSRLAVRALLPACFRSRSYFILTCRCDTRQCVLSRNHKSGSFDRRAHFCEAVFSPISFCQYLCKYPRRT